MDPFRGFNGQLCMAVPFNLLTTRWKIYRTVQSILSLVPVVSIGPFCSTCRPTLVESNEGLLVGFTRTLPWLQGCDSNRRRQVQVYLSLFQHRGFARNRFLSSAMSFLTNLAHRAAPVLGATVAGSVAYNWKNFPFRPRYSHSLSSWT